MDCSNEEDFRQEIDYQVELVSKINATLAQNSQHDLFNLEQSLFKMVKNEKFIENFKSNQEIYSATTNSIKALLQADEKYNTGQNGILILGRLAQCAKEKHRSNYEKFIIETHANILFILQKRKNYVGDDLNFVNAIYEICLSIDKYCVDIIEILTSSKLIHLLVQILNKNASFNLSKYATIIENFSHEFMNYGEEIENNEDLELYLSFIELYNLYYESFCIIVPFYKNEYGLNQSFHDILQSLVGSLYYISNQFDAQSRRRSSSLKMEICDKLMFILKQDLFHSNFGYKVNDALEILEFELCLESERVDTSTSTFSSWYSEELLMIMCKVVCHNDTDKDRISTCLYVLRHMLYAKRIETKTFLGVAWNVIEPAWSRMFIHEDHRKLNPGIILEGLLHLNKDDLPQEFLKSILNCLKQFLQIDVKRKKSFISDGTLLVMSRLVKYFDKRELYDAFQTEVMPLLELLYEIYKNCNQQELYRDFEAFYQKLFCGRRKLKQMLKNKYMDLWSKYRC